MQRLDSWQGKRNREWTGGHIFPTAMVVWRAVACMLNADLPILPWWHNPVFLFLFISPICKRRIVVQSFFLFNISRDVGIYGNSAVFMASYNKMVYRRCEDSERVPGKIHGLDRLNLVAFCPRMSALEKLAAVPFHESPSPKNTKYRERNSEHQYKCCRPASSDLSFTTGLALAKEKARDLYLPHGAEIKRDPLPRFTTRAAIFIRSGARLGGGPVIFDALAK